MPTRLLDQDVHWAIPVFSLLAIAFFPFWMIRFAKMNLGPGDILLMAVGGIWVVQTGKLVFAGDRLTALGILLFLGAASTSMLWSPSPLEGLKQLVQYLFIFLVLVPTLGAIFQDRRFRWYGFLVLLITTTAIAVGGASVTVLSGQPLESFSFIYGNYNGYHWIVATAFILNLFTASQQIHPTVRLICATIALGTLSIVVTVLTITALIQAMIGIWAFGFYLLSERTNRHRTVYLAATGVGLLLAAVLIASNWAAFYNLASLQERLPMYHGAFEAGGRAFPLGHGIGSSPVAMDFLPENFHRSIHNFVLHFWVEIGLVGTLGIVLIVMTWIWRVFLSPLRTPADWSTFEVAVVTVFAAYIIGVALFQPHPVRRVWWVPFAFGWAAFLDKKQDG